MAALFLHFIDLRTEFSEGKAVRINNVPGIRENQPRERTGAA